MIPGTSNEHGDCCMRRQELLQASEHRRSINEAALGDAKYIPSLV
jgi:hypothetical protein